MVQIKYENYHVDITPLITYELYYEQENCVFN